MEFIRYSDYLEAMVITGGAAESGYKEMGDCLLINFRSRFFAVADSSARNLSLSRKILLQCNNLLDDLFIPDYVNRSDDYKDMTQRLKAGMDQILLKHYGEGSCTFTGVLLLKKESVMNIFLLHTGDSSLIMFDGLGGASTKLTRNNFWMAGKSTNLYQSDVIEIPAGSWLMLATDGMIDVINSVFASPDDFFNSRMRSNLGDDLFRNLMNRSKSGDIYDDIGMILFKPENIVQDQIKFMIGGILNESGIGSVQ